MVCGQQVSNHLVGCALAMSSGASPEMNLFCHVFQQIGQLGFGEFCDLLMRHIVSRCSTRYELAMKSYHVSGSGQIEFEEFCELLMRHMEEGDTAHDDSMLEAFKTFDKDGSGTISAEELKQVRGVEYREFRGWGKGRIQVKTPESGN